ncbi:MAG: hypothetical protein AB1489_29730, partial [Acidobacteriota bacterium]
RNNIIFLPPGKRSLTLPFNEKEEIYSSVFNQTTNKLYILTTFKLIVIDVDSLCFEIIRELPSQEDYPQYETLFVKENLVIVYRYGIIGWYNNENFELTNNLYSHISLFANNDIVAIDQCNKLIHIFRLGYGIIAENYSPSSIYYIGRVKNDVVIIWDENGKLWGGRVSSNSGKIETLICFDNYRGDVFVPINQTGQLAIGLLDGNLLIWQVGNNSYQHIEVPDSYRIVELFWPEKENKLIIGCRDGDIKICHL